ncbi:MAG: D-alanyl-D-alanine carboxypeptidase/D-alanyl-D-alanine-endopeptidase [Paludibacteraceae bacterium]|nr:D-alanyl-D-alanine carboxypeptidase/D-alanyl-D-alanine-endopeptidase [Paludibacteraceae bacterium]
MIKLLFILLSVLTTHTNTKDANMGVLICDYNSGEVIDSHRANAVIPPASTIKLLTTATVLDVYGGDYQIKTPITYSGEIKDGVLEGNLYIEGKGDPTLGSKYIGNQCFLQNWAKEVQKAGIRKINGSIVADLSYFDRDATNPGWLWDDIGNYYAPGIFALSYMDNTQCITLSSGADGSKAKILKTSPEIPEMTYENIITCSKTPDVAYVRGVPYSDYRFLTGTIPCDRKTYVLKGDIPNPGLLLAKHFTKELCKLDITVANEATYITVKDRTTRKTLFTHSSEPLKKIIRHTNHKSDNLYAEMLFRLLAARIATPCTIDNSTKFIRSYWKEKGINLDNCRILDGSGLAPQDAISCSVYVQLLKYMYKSKYKDAFLESLPTSGESGTLKSFLKDTELHGKVHAKSGSISGTKNFAGYIYLPNGKVWVFAVMTNSANCKTRKLQKVIEEYLLSVYKTKYLQK